MSLLSEAMEAYTIIDKVTEGDGYGGTVTTWKEGAQISGAMVLDTSMQARTAQAQGVKAVYTFTTRKDVTLSYHDVLRRDRDSKIFRVTSDGSEKRTPASAGLNMRQVTAEEWNLTSEITPEEAENNG